MKALSNLPFESLYIGMPVISGNTNRKGEIIELINEEFATRQEDNEVVIKWEGHLSKTWHCQLNHVYHYDELKTFFSIINDTSKAVKAKRNETAVMMHVMEEVGELALELAIHNKTSYKQAGDDGVVGEAVDSIICLLDLIYTHKPGITEDELIAIATKKCQKWKDKAKTLPL